MSIQPAVSSRTRFCLFLIPPVALTLVAAMGYLIYTSLGYPLPAREILAGLLVNLIAGLIAIAPVIYLANRGAEILLRGVMASMAIRMILILAGAALTMGKGWQLEKNALITWLTLGYVTLLITETSLAIWLMRRQKH